MAKRYNRDGLLRVDGEEDVKGTSPGSMKSLNLDHGGYIGYVPLNSTKWVIANIGGHRITIIFIVIPQSKEERES